MRTNLRTRYVVLAASLLVSACGGGGGGSSPSGPAPSPAPVVSVSASPPSVLAGQTSSIAWSSTNATSCTASGAWSDAIDISGSRTITQPGAGSHVYTVTCTGPGGSGSGSATLLVSASPNTVSIVVDGGPGGSALNVPYVNVTVCVPGTSNCQTVDHVIVDTGSFGLRLMKSTLNAGLNLPAVTNSNGNELGECGVFASGFTWGTVRRADVKLGGEVASAIPVQIIGEQPGGSTGIPGDCSSTGADQSTVAKLGANGILGVGMFASDCDACTTGVIAATYYSCKTSGCSGTKITAAQAVTNPVAYFPQDNNGVVILLPAVTDAGATNPTGTLVFGIGTQANNALGNATVYAADNAGNFSTTYNGKTTANGFSDSGSNGIFFTDTTLVKCKDSIGFYCPPAPLALSASIKAAKGNASTSVNFSIVNIDTLPSNMTAANAGGTSGGSLGATSFDWGLPFFFGRKVFTAISGTATPGGTGPFLAF